jgi:hypothetical protein
MSKEDAVLDAICKDLGILSADRNTINQSFL